MNNIIQKIDFSEIYSLRSRYKIQNYLDIRYRQIFNSIPFRGDYDFDPHPHLQSCHIHPVD